MKKIAIIVGHNEKKQGAKNKNHEISEFMFNTVLANELGFLLIKNGFTPKIIYRNCSYSKLPEKVNRTNADIAISLHCNAFNLKQNGSETLYYRHSIKGKRLARLMQTEVVKCLDLKDRGIKPRAASYIGKAGDRGGILLEKTTMPCVILEPFFIDCDRSLMLGMEKTDELARAYMIGILNYFKEV